MGAGRVAKFLIAPILITIAIVVYLIDFEIKFIKGEVKPTDIIEEVIVKAKDWVAEKLRSTI